VLIFTTGKVDISLSSISPAMASKEGGTPVTVTGAGFEDTADLSCRWSRVEPETEQLVEKETPGTYKSSTEIVCDSPQWDEATCPYCDKQVHGSTCLPSCANTYPWDNKEAHASVLMDDGTPHFNAQDNHHLAAGIGHPRGKYPCTSCANEYDEHDNPHGAWPIGWKNTQDGSGAHGGQEATVFYGHHGSRFLRTNNDNTPTELGSGQFIKILGQFFTIVKIEACADNEVGCWCDGEWGENQLSTNNSAATNSVIGSYPIGPDPASYINKAMYNYDNNPGVGAPTCAAYSSAADGADTLVKPDGTGAALGLTNANLGAGTWEKGTKITLDQPLYRVGGQKNVKFFTNEVYVSSKKPCVDCKCSGGCPLTLSVTNNGRTWSGGGTNGVTWHGSALKYTAKFLIPQVSHITFPGLEGRRDSTRMFVPPTGNTRIRVHGQDFQPGPLLRCFFDTPRIAVRAEFIDENTLECQTPSFVSRDQDFDLKSNPALDNKCADANNALKHFANDIFDNTASNRMYDTECTDSKQNGAAMILADQGSGMSPMSWSFSHVQVTNNGKHQDLSEVVHRRPDGTRSALEGEGSPHRSTCYQLEYPSSSVDAAVRPGHEQDEPCRFSHQDSQGSGDHLWHPGNDVQIKYSSCYESLRSESNGGSAYRGTLSVGSNRLVNSSHSLGQKFRIPATSAGPLVAIDLHLIKDKAATGVSECTDPTDCAVASRRATTLEVCISAGGFKGHGQTLACEWISIQNIVQDGTNGEDTSYMVYFQKPPYLLAYYQTGPGNTAGFEASNAGQADATYFLTVSHVSGPETVSWAMSDQSSHSTLPGSNGFYFEAATNVTQQVETNLGFRADFYTCDGCRWQYQSIQTSDTTTYQVGKITGRQNHSESWLQTHPSVNCKSTMTQSIGRAYANEFYDTNEGLPRQNSAADPTGVYGDECGSPTYREQAAQAIRPLEDVTVTKMRTKMRVAWTDDDPSVTSHNDRTVAGDFKNADGAQVSVWITEHGKMGEHVCQTFTGQAKVSDADWLDDFKLGPGGSGADTMLGCGIDNGDCMHCDVNGDGRYNELCFLGALCNKSLPAVYGGCGVGGICAMSNVVTNGHVLQNHADGTGPFTSRCGEDDDCEHSQTLKVQNSIKLPEATSATDAQDVIWEFDKSVVLRKHTTYYVNMAIDESIVNSDSVYWYAGTAATTPTGAGQANEGPGRTPFLGSYIRTNVVIDGQSFFTWVQNPAGTYFNLELMRCVTSLPSIESFTTGAEGTGSCLGRSSPRGGIDGPMITFTGKNFFPSANLRAVFLREDGSMGPVVNCESTKADFTEMKCKAPTFDPHKGTDCSIPGSCQGVHVMPTNDGVNFGPQFFSPKFIEPYNSCTNHRSPTYDATHNPTACDAIPVSINGSHHVWDHFVQKLGENNAKYCFSDIHVSTSGNDYSGDGSMSRPFRTIQRGVDAANTHDVIVLQPGTYTGTGNRGIRTMNKKIEIKTMESDPDEVGISHRDQTIVDCEHEASGFVINNNKDSMSLFAGYLDFDAITVKNCENLRIY
jgi:hypothetical protein